MKILKSNNSIVFEEDDVKTILPLNNLLFINNGNTFSFRTKNGRRLFSVKYDEITEPTSSSVEDLIGKLNGLFNSASGGGGSCKLQEKSVDIIQNGKLEVLPDDGFDGLSKAVINVNVPQSNDLEFTFNSPSMLFKLNNQEFTANESPYRANSINLLEGNTLTSLNDFMKNSEVQNVSKMPNTSEVTSLVGAFRNTPIVSLMTIDNTFDFRKVIDMTACFANDTLEKSLINSLDLTNWQVENLSNTTTMFYGYNGDATEINLSGWHTRSLTATTQMFMNCSTIQKINLDEWFFENVAAENMSMMFQGCSALTEISMMNCSELSVNKIKQALTAVGLQDQVTVLSNFVPKEDVILTLDADEGYRFVVNDSYILTKDSSETINISEKINYEPITKLLFNVFSSGGSLREIKSFSNKVSLEDCYQMFQNCTSLTSLNLSNFDTSNVTGMGSMFKNCYSLTSLDVSNFDTTNVTDMGGMFDTCELLTSLNVTNFDTSNVAYMNNMFFYCKGLKSLDVSSFDTSNVITFSYMFYKCNSLTSLDLSSFNTSNATDMGSMFGDCSSLQSLNLSNFDTTNVTIMNSMFQGCDALNEITCKQAFKDWCITNQDEIALPEAMREGGGGNWIIVE